MKKGISKVLSVMCGIASLSGMFGMNSAGAAKLTGQQVSTGFSAMCSRPYDPSGNISDDGININIEKFIAKIIYKLDSFLSGCSGQTLQDLSSDITRGIMNCMGDTDMSDITDPGLYYLNILVAGLQMVSEGIPFNDNEPSADTLRQFARFKFAIQYMIEIVKNLSQKSNITPDDRRECVKAINLTIEKINSKMEDPDVRYIQDISNKIAFGYRPGVLSHGLSWGCTLL